MAEQQDLVVHAKKAALWELERGGDTSEDKAVSEVLSLINSDGGNM